MPRLINLADQKNLWGATTTAGLEPQRTDLWFVDMTSVVKGLNAQNLFSILKLAPVPSFFKQFVQSVTIPEIRTKPEVIRRDSLPYQMPSWDDPLDAIKIVFLLDTNENVNQSRVLSVLQAWQAIVRAGRGTRSSGYNSVNEIALNSSFRYDYTFPIRVALLRGSLTSKSSLSADQQAQMNQQMLNQAAYQTEITNDITQGMFVKAMSSSPTITSGFFSFGVNLVGRALDRRELTETAVLEVAAQWNFVNVWLAGWKLGDLSYADSKLLTVEATLYAESFEETSDSFE